MLAGARQISPALHHPWDVFNHQGSRLCFISSALVNAAAWQLQPPTSTASRAAVAGPCPRLFERLRAKRIHRNTLGPSAPRRLYADPMCAAGYSSSIVSACGGRAMAGDRTDRVTGRQGRPRIRPAAWDKQPPPKNHAPVHVSLVWIVQSCSAPAQQ